MASIKQKKNYLVSREGVIYVYPSLDEHKEKSILRRIIKRLIQLRKDT